MGSKGLMITVLLALFAGASTQTIRCLVTHDEPTAKERELLSLEAGELEGKAREVGYIVWRQDDLLFVRPKNLYNLDYMQRCMDGFAALQVFVSKGQFRIKFSELTPTQKAGVRAIMADSFLMEEAGPLIAKDDTEFMIEQRRSLTLTNGRRDVSITLPNRATEGAPSFLDAPSKDELDKFKAEEGLAFRKSKFRDALVFTFAPDNLWTVTRPTAISTYMHELTDLLEQQRKSFVAARAALLASFGAAEPMSGQNWTTLDDETKRYIELKAKDSFAALGFSSREDADRFFFDARVKASSNQVFVGIGVNERGTRTRKLATIDVIRN